MRTITVGLLLALLVAVCQVNGGTIPNFKKEKVYVYDYEGRIATGISEHDDKHFSGFGIKSHLKIYTKDDKVYFKFYDTLSGRVNKRVDDFFEPLEIEYTKSEDEAVKKTVDDIEKPFAAVYEDGVFKKYYDPEDTISNWRKAVVGLFQTQFHPTEAHESHFYKVSEEGVGGKCKTLYKIAHIPSDDTHVEEVLNVTKVRLYDECETRPHYFYTSLDGYKCSHCKQENINPLKTFARVQYEIKGNKQQFTIEKVYSSGTISFTPFTTHGQTVLSVVNQTLSLVSATEEAAPFEVHYDEYKEHDTLAFQFYPDTVSHETMDRYHYNRVYKKPVPENPVEEIQPILQDLAKVYKESGKESKSVMKVIYYLQKFNYEQFVELCEKYVSIGEEATKEQKTIKYVLLEVLPYVGTKGAFKYLLELVEKDKVDVPTANELIYKFPFYIKEICPKTFVQFEAFLETSVAKDHLKTWHTGILAYGTLVHKACVRDHKDPHGKDYDFHFNPELCTKYVKNLKDKFYSEVEKSPKDASVYIRALANTEHPDAFEVFAKVVKDDKYPHLLRQDAIWGIIHYEKEKRDEIVAIVAPLYFDYTVDYVLRIYAFEVLMYLHPSTEFFSNLILNLETEPNEKVASYIFSTLYTTANTTDPCHQYLGEKSKYVLQFVKPHKEYDIVRHSTNRIFSAYNAKYNYGRTSQFAMIPSEHSVVPRELYIRQSFNLLGYNFDFIELGFTSDEDSALSHLGEYFAPAGLKKTHEREHADYIKDIVSKLHLDKHREHGSDDRYEVYVKMFGHDLKFTQKYDYHDSNEIHFDGDKIVYDLHSTSYTEAEYIVPNEMGFPVVLSLKVPVTLHLSGSAKFQGRQSEGYAGNLDISSQLSTDFTVSAKMYVYTPTFRKYGYSLYTNGGIQFPIKGSLDVDSHTKKFALKYVPSTEPYNVINYDTTPMAIFPEEPYYYPIKYADHPVHKEYKFGQDYFGVGLKASFEYDYLWNDYGSYREFFKSFFHKYTRYEDYFYLADKWYAGTRGFLDYAVINPTAKPFHFNLTFAPSETHPTTEFLITNKYEHSRYFEQEKGHDTCKSTVSVVARGPVERKWDAQISVSKTYPEEDFRKVVFNYERSPIPNYDDKKFELHYKSNVTYVNYMTVFTDKPEEISVKYNGKLTIGNEEESTPKEIHVKMLAEQTEEHKNADKSKIWYYQKCKQDVQEHKAEFTEACWRVMKDAGRIDKITFDFEYKNIPKEYKVYFNSVYTWFRHTFYNNLYIDYFHGSNDENHVNVVANFSYYYPVFDVKITRPDHTVYYNKVYAPAVFPKYEPFSIAEDAKERFMRKFFSYQQARCFVTGDRVNTFDLVDYPFDKEDKSYHLAVGDCENHHFFGFVKEVDTPNMDKAVKFYFHDDVFEVVPNADGEALELYVNKEKKEGVKGFIHSVTHHTNYKLSVSIWGKGVYIESKDYGVHLYTDGKNTCFMVNNFYRGKQCGLCGDLDGESHHEFQKPDGTPVSYSEMSKYYRYSDE